MEECRQSLRSRGGAGRGVPDHRVALCISRGSDYRRFRSGDPPLPDSAGAGYTSSSKEECGLHPTREQTRLRHGAMSPIEAVPKDRGTVLAEERTDLAVQRTIIASERTLMAWIRTALSMIGFGFSIYKFFQYLPEEIAAGNIKRPNAPRNLGMTLIALGTTALAAATWQHRNFLNKIGETQKRHVWSIAFGVALAVILI